MPPAASPPVPSARLSVGRWLRIGMLLFVAQALALGLQALLLIHKEGELLVGLTVSRVGIAADELQTAFARAAANGLTLAEARGVGRLLPRLAADDTEIAAIGVFDADGQPLYGTTAPPDDVRRAILRQDGPWSRFDSGRALLAGQVLHDELGHRAGGVLFHLRPDALDARRAATRDATLARLGLTLAGVAAALPLLLAAVARLGRRFAPRLRLFAAALLLAGASSLALSVQALPGLSAQLAPALDAKAASLARILATRIDHAVTLGIPLARLPGVADYFDDTLARHPEILALRLDGTGLAHRAERAGTPGDALAAPIAAAPGVRVVAVTDGGVVARELRNLAVDLAIVFLVAVVLFNEALGAILAGDDLAPAAGRARLGQARLAVFLLILSEELTRAFLPLHIAGLAGGDSTAIGLPISAYMLSFALFTPFAGRWATRFGVAPTFAVGALMSAAGFAWALAGGGYWAFVAARCLCAAGYAVGTMAMQQHFLDAAAPGERTRALALYVGALQTAAICGSAVGGLIAERFGAAAVFSGAAALGLLALVIHRLDRAVPAPGSATAPAVPLWPLLGRRAVLLPLLTAAVPAKLALAGFLFYLVPLALQHEGYGSGAAGRALMLYFLLAAAGNPLASWLSDRFGWNRRLVTGGGLVIATGGLAGVLADNLGGTAVLLAGIVTLGIGTGLGAAALQALIGREGPGALVLLRTGERLGAVAGPLFAGSLLGLLAYGGTMAAIGAVVFAAILVFALAGPAPEKPA